MISKFIALVMVKTMMIKFYKRFQLKKMGIFIILKIRILSENVIYHVCRKY